MSRVTFLHREQQRMLLISFAPEWPHLSTHSSVCDSPPTRERWKREQPPLCVGKHTRCNNPARAQLKTRHLQGKFSSIENNEGAQILGSRRVLGNGFGEKKKGACSGLKPHFRPGYVPAPAVTLLSGPAQALSPALSVRLPSVLPLSSDPLPSARAAGGIVSPGAHL